MARRRSARHARYGNPAALDLMVARQEAPTRAAWQKPTAVIRALGLRRGQVVADIGVGPEDTLSYSALVQSWPEITRLARDGGKPQGGQSQMFEQP